MTDSMGHSEWFSAEVFSQVVTWPAFDEFPRPWLSTAARALKDRLPAGLDRSRCGLFWASDLDSIAADRIFERSRREDAGRFASPAAFRSTLAGIDPSALALELAISGPVITFSIEADTTIAVQSARRWLEAGRLHAAIVICESAHDADRPYTQAAAGVTPPQLARFIHVTLMITRRSPAFTAPSGQ